jgi:hypothetical protein
MLADAAKELLKCNVRFWRKADIGQRPLLPQSGRSPGALHGDKMMAEKFTLFAIITEPTSNFRRLLAPSFQWVTTQLAQTASRLILLVVRFGDRYAGHPCSSDINIGMRYCNCWN